VEPFKTSIKISLKKLPNTGGKLAFLNSRPLTSSFSFSYTFLFSNPLSISSSFSKIS
jgi:hypothetical protein